MIGCEYEHCQPVFFLSARERYLPIHRHDFAIELVGANFINVVRAAFSGADPKSAEKTVKWSVFFLLFRDPSK